MTPRRRLLLVMTATFLASMMIWGALGVRASGERKTVLIKRVHHGFYRREPSKPVFILAIGSDAGSERYDRPGPADRGRADSIHIVAINPERKAGTIVGIPRDTLVSGGGFTGKINGALTAGGPDLMARVVEEFSGVTLDYTMLTSFDGFEDMVNELGGVVVDIPYRMSDGRSNAYFERGQQVLGGYQALAFSRNRHNAPNGDFSRSENQGLVLLGALRRARAEAFENPGVLLKYLRIFFKYVSTDLTPGEALDLGLLATRVQTQDVRNLVVEGVAGTTSDGASVVRATTGSLRMLADVADNGVIDEIDPDAYSTADDVIPDPEPVRPRRRRSPTPSTEPSPSPSESATPLPTDEPIPTETPDPDPTGSPSPDPTLPARER